MGESFAVLLALAAAAVLLSWVYFGRYRLRGRPLGVMTLGDVTVMMVAVVVVPYLYLVLPVWAIAGIFVAAAVSLIHSLLEPVVRSRWAIWPAALGPVAADLIVHHLEGGSGGYVALNDLVLLAVIVGMANLWAQSGMKARDLAVLALALAVYDVVATSILPLTDAVFNHLGDMPLAPSLGWGTGTSRLEIGLGDVLMAAVFPLVARKAFGDGAGISAMSLVLLAIAGMMAGVWVAGARMTAPAMAVLGPLMVLHYTYWSRRNGGERTTREYREGQAFRVAYFSSDSQK